ncbi:hypothetical protein ACO22_08102 [Paracoccidioides brasiliensis]|uniref:Uncharacterized protein n=1 Tax=Paracoccidioides brasiliensis TaxID=121759 RepID=A0A1D2J2S7_PARBR|nr:hypothetical protein ACO22_08102 [Paracoccidioides brasiliensis]
MGDWETGRLGDWAGLAAGEREQVESEGREPEEHWVIGPVALPLASKTSPLQPQQQQQQQQQQQLMERDVRLRGPRDGHQDPSRALIPEVANNNRSHVARSAAHALDAVGRMIASYPPPFRVLAVGLVEQSAGHRDR